jgi:hypothetical protein
MCKAMGISGRTAMLCTSTSEVAAGETQPEILLEVAHGAVSEILRGNLSGLILFQAQRMLASGQLLLPCLDLLLLCECVGRKHSVDNLWQLSQALVYIVHPTFIALHACGCVIPVSFCFGCDGKFRNLLRGLVSLDLLTRASDVQDKRVLGRLEVERGVVSLAIAAAVEAV